MNIVEYVERAEKEATAAGIPDDATRRLFGLILGLWVNEGTSAEKITLYAAWLCGRGTDAEPAPEAPPHPVLRNCFKRVLEDWQYTQEASVDGIILLTGRYTSMVEGDKSREQLAQLLKKLVNDAVS